MNVQNTSLLETAGMTNMMCTFISVILRSATYLFESEEQEKIKPETNRPTLRITDFLPNPIKLFCSTSKQPILVFITIPLKEPIELLQQLHNIWSNIT